MPVNTMERRGSYKSHGFMSAAIGDGEFGFSQDSPFWGIQGLYKAKKPLPWGKGFF
jgi:hypothetical protein